MLLFKVKKNKAISVKGNDKDTPTKGETLTEYREEHK